MFHRPQTHCDLSAHSASVCQTLHTAGALTTDAQLTWEGRIRSMCLKRRSPNKIIAEWPFVDLQNSELKDRSSWDVKLSWNSWLPCKHHESPCASTIESFWRTRYVPCFPHWASYCLGTTSEEPSSSAPKKKRRRGSADQCMTSLHLW